MTIKTTVIATALALSTLTPIAAHAKNTANVEIGTLTCHQSDKANFVLYSKASFECEYKNTSGETAEFTGKVRKLGVDLSTSKSESLVWYVFAPSLEAHISGLEGNFVGASADVSVGAGVGTHVLVGGLDKSFALQPISVAGQEGIGLAAGIEQFKLKFEK